MSERKRANRLSLADTIWIKAEAYNIETIHRCRDDKVQLTLIPLAVPFDPFVVNLEPWQEVDLIQREEPR